MPIEVNAFAVEGAGLGVIIKFYFLLVLSELEDNRLSPRFGESSPEERHLCSSSRRDQRRLEICWIERSEQDQRVLIRKYLGYLLVIGSLSEFGRASFGKFLN